MPCLINSFGLIINSAYAITYYRFASREEAVRCRYYLIAGLAIIAPGIGLEIIIGRATMGYIAAAMNILMFFSPLSAASEVIRTRSVAKFPFLPLLFSFLCGLSWTAYGVHTHDNPIIIREFLSFCLLIPTHFHLICIYLMKCSKCMRCYLWDYAAWNIHMV